jgi:hypothetical protein
LEFGHWSLFGIWCLEFGSWKLILYSNWRRAAVSYAH